MRIWTIRPWQLAMPLVALAMLACGGCTNAPGALELRVMPEKDTFRAAEAIRLSATLTATGGNICYGRASWWTVTLERDGGDGAFRSRPLFFCGTGLMALAPLFVVIVPVCALDIGDGLGRFEALPRGEQRKHQLTLVPYEDPGGRWLEVGRDREPDMAGRPPMVSLPGGRYRVRVEFQNEYSFVAPLFWAPYEHPLVATSEFAIVDDAATAVGR
jgi:hypothetical protein